MKSFWRFITQLDKQALRASLVLIAMFGTVGVILFFGNQALNLPEEDFSQFFEHVRSSNWALPLTILTFILAAFFAAPQWALIAGVVVVFGPVNGGIYAWIATMCSASLDFWLGKMMGADRLQKIGGALIERIVGIVRRNGFVTSFAVRLVPTGPFVLVNMAAGVSRMKFPSFLAGTALGIIPKIMVVVLIGQGILSERDRQIYMAGFMVAALLLILIMIFARRRLNRLVEPVDNSD